MLLIAESAYRIDVSSTPGRNPAREHSDRDQSDTVLPCKARVVAKFFFDFAIEFVWQ